jgi:D-3-phosphoglycerate dehydrogenase
MLYIVTRTRPASSAVSAPCWAEAGINIGNFNLGRRQTGGEAVVLLSVDQPISADVVTQACALEGVRVVKALSF